MEEKKCRKCFKKLPINNFYADARSKDNLFHTCKLCCKVLAVKYYQKNKEAVKNKAREWRAENKDAVKAMNRVWFDKNKDKKRDRDREYYKKYSVENQEKIKERFKKWYLNNKDKSSANRIKWRKAHPEKDNDWRKRHPGKAVVYSQNRRARIISSGGVVTLEEWNELLKKLDYTCVCCKRKDVKLTQDHIVPLSTGGEHNIRNIQPLCQSCNSKKGTKTINFVGHFVER